MTIRPQIPAATMKAKAPPSSKESLASRITQATTQPIDAVTRAAVTTARADALKAARHNWAMPRRVSAVATAADANDTATSREGPPPRK
ncbi:hypothetical protein [Leifsonella bigeumensis]|uniref:hypothetical protein n=1 Tax=Leifsonella bigeumensis TaxID=433643 RepID=UPI0031D3F5B6